MPFVLQKAPAQIEKIETSRKRAKTSPGGGNAVNHDKQISLRIDLSHDRYTEALEWLLPGCDLFAKGMSGEDVAFKQNVTNRKKLGGLTVKIYDGEGRALVVEMQSAMPRGSNVITFGQRGSTRHMPLRIVGAVARDALPKLDDFLRADVLVDVSVQQMDLEEELKRAGKGGKGGGSGKGKGGPKLLPEAAGQMQLDS